MSDPKCISASFTDNVVNILRSILPLYDYTKPGRAQETNWSVGEHVPKVGPKN